MSDDFAYFVDPMRRLYEGLTKEERSLVKMAVTDDLQRLLTRAREKFPPRKNDPERPVASARYKFWYDVLTLVEVQGAPAESEVSPEKEETW